MKHGPVRTYSNSFACKRAVKNEWSDVQLASSLESMIFPFAGELLYGDKAADFFRPIADAVDASGYPFRI